jgi:hypothetical protein
MRRVTVRQQKLAPPWVLTRRGAVGDAHANMNCLVTLALTTCLYYTIVYTKGFMGVKKWERES